MTVEQKTIEAALNRHYGQLPEERERVAKVNAQFTDWRTICHVCKKPREGTLHQLKHEPCVHCGAIANGPKSQ